MDVSLYGMRYGWASEMTDGGLVLTHGDDRAVIKHGENTRYDKGTVELNGQTRTCTVHIIDGKYYVS